MDRRPIAINCWQFFTSDVFPIVAPIDWDALKIIHFRLGLIKASLDKSYGIHESVEWSKFRNVKISDKLGFKDFTIFLFNKDNCNPTLAESAKSWDRDSTPKISGIKDNQSTLQSDFHQDTTMMTTITTMTTTTMTTTTTMMMRGRPEQSLPALPNLVPDDSFCSSGKEDGEKEEVEEWPDWDLEDIFWHLDLEDPWHLDLEEVAEVSVQPV